MSDCGTPNCTYGDQPHYVPPGFGMIGFYACDPPEDLTNHTRCYQGTCDKDSPDHPWVRFPEAYK